MESQSQNANGRDAHAPGWGGKDVVGEVKGIDVMGVLVAGRGARDRGGRRKEVEVNPKR